jgi:hypothetical protein
MMRHVWDGLARWSAAVLALGVTLSTGALPTFAQEGGVRSAQVVVGHCGEPGEILFTLTGIGAEAAADGTRVVPPERSGSERAVPVRMSATTLETSLSTLLEQERAIVILKKEDGTGEIIACGEIGGLLTMQMAGMVMPGDELAVGLREIGESGFSGLALIEAAGRQASLRIYLMQQPDNG